MGTEPIKLGLKLNKNDKLTNMWLNALKKCNLKTPFTTRQAYEALCTEATIKGKRRKRVPGGTNELSKRLKLCKRVERVNPKCAGKYIALWDFVD